MRPTKYLTWSRRDRGLAEGLLAYEDAVGAHGIPSWLAQDPDRRFEVDEVVDHAAAALDEARAEFERGGGDNYGVRLVVVDQGPRPG